MNPLFPSLRRVESDAEIFAHRFLIAFTVTLGAMMELVDTSIVNVAIPHMMGTLGATLDEIAWVSTGYVVANVIVLPISGWLANWFGRRNYLALSIMLFIGASMLCGASSHLEELVFWRIVQGLGGGGLIATAQATLYEVFPRKEAGVAMAIFGLGIMFGPMLGPTLGGWLTDAWSWPWIFYINLPLGLLALLLVLMVVPDSRYGQRAEQVDFVGLLLLALGIGCLQTLLERGEKLDWFASREIVTLTWVASLSLVTFVWQELKHPHPIVNLRILRDTQFAASLVLTFILGICLYAVIFVFPVFAQTLLGFTAWETGLVILPGAMASGLTMAMMGRFTAKTALDLRLLVVLGIGIFGWSMWQHSLFTTQSGWDEFLPAMIWRGVGLGMVFIPLNNLAMGNLRPEEVPDGSGLYNLTRQLGGSVGIAVSATLFVQWQQAHRANLIHHVTLYSDAAVARLDQLKALVISHGALPAQAQEKALRILDSMVVKQAAMLAFEHLFLLFGILFICATPLLLLMPRGHFTRGGEDEAALAH